MKIIKEIIILCLLLMYLFVFDNFCLAVNLNEYKDVKKNGVNSFINDSNSNFLSQKENISYIENEVIIKYKTSFVDLKSNKTHIESFEIKNGLNSTEEIKNLNMKVYKSKETVETIIEKLKNDPNIEYVEPNYKRYVATTTNDIYLYKQWGLDSYGQSINGSSVVSGNDINATDFWSGEQGYQDDVIVAVIDTGIDYNHPDLKDNMWNGINCVDENNNYLGECLHGYDFENSDKNPMPILNHGTHVAGIIAGVANNNKGITGVSSKNNLKIMALKSGLTVAQNIKSIEFAQNNWAKVINMSYGGSHFSQAEKDAIDAFTGIVAASAGNNSSNNEITHNYPSDYESNNIISVAALGKDENLASFSNYGITSVDIAAPGEDIYSTVVNENGDILYSNNFNSLTTPNIPSDWQKTGNWGTYYLSSSVGNVLYSDLSYPYMNNNDSSIVLPVMNMSGASAGAIKYITRCDTEYLDSSWGDYMTVEISNDSGSSYREIYRWDEASIDDDNNSSTSSVSNISVSIPNDYLNNKFRFRFRWITNSSDNSYDGCLIDNLSIAKFYGGDDLYDFKDGTSMAAPYVAGIAGMAYSYNPSATNSTIKSTILSNGDSLTSLTGQILTGKRINLYKTVRSMGSFLDVPVNYAFRTYIEDLFSKGVINGYSDGIFKPADNVTRGAMSKFIKNGFGFETNTSCGDFTDVNSNNIFYPYITTLKCEGVISGFPDGSFRPEDFIDRGAATKFIINGVRKKVGNENFLSKNQDDVFPDVTRDNVFYEYIMAAYSNGIISGYPNGFYNPLIITDRGAMSKMVSKTILVLP